MALGITTNKDGIVLGKIDINKQHKYEALLDAAYTLFTTKGLNNTSIADIVDRAGIAKGTFYLYFKDKYDINQKLLVHQTSQLFEAAMERVNLSGFQTFKERLLFVVNDIIDALSGNKTILMYISKNLGLGFYRNVIAGSSDLANTHLSEVYKHFLTDARGSYRNPEMMLYLIIELVGGTIYTSVLYERPVPVSELKPELLKAVSGIIEQFAM